MPSMLRPGQFSLKSLFIATAFVAVGCVVVRFIATTNLTMDQLEFVLVASIPICGIVGALRGQVRPWLRNGVAIYLLLLILAYLLR